MPTPPILLAHNGLPLFDILLPPGASAPEEFAADELRRALYEMIGPARACAGQVERG